jgi:hypothetical protein
MLNHRASQSSTVSSGALSRSWVIVSLVGLCGFGLLGGVVGCSEKSAEARAANPEVDLGAPQISWQAKTREQRMGFMAASVHPRMKKLFVENDKSYADFSCETCHGADMELRDYQMPNDIYALPTENTLEEARDYDEEVTDFMVNKVLPEFKKLLNQGAGPETDVSCFSCHPKE